MLIAVDSYV